MKETPEETVHDIRTALEVPQDIWLDTYNTMFRYDYLLLRIPERDVQQLARQYNERVGNAIDFRGVGFYAPTLFLENTAQERLPVIVVSNDQGLREARRLEYHEMLHIWIDQYFENRPIEAFDLYEEIRPIETAAIENKIDLDNTHAVMEFARKDVAGLYKYMLEIFHQELATYAANVNPWNGDNMDDFIDGLAKDFSLPSDGNTMYTGLMNQWVQEGKDFVLQYTNAKVASQFEEKCNAIAGHYRNQVVLVEDWAHKLLEASDRDLTKYVSRLLIIPTARLWVLGVFFNEDPRKLKSLFQTGAKA